jgi:hypothetical protein
MIVDIVATLISFLNSKLSVGTSVDQLHIQPDEYNPLDPNKQLVIMERPSRTRFLAPNVLHIEQDAQLVLSFRNINYQDAKINTTKASFEALKMQIIQVLNKYRYDSLSQSFSTTIQMGSWTNDAIQRGYSRGKEPLSFTSRLTVTIVSQEVDI